MDDDFGYDFEPDPNVWLPAPYPDSPLPGEPTIDEWAAQAALIAWADDDPSEDDLDLLQRLLMLVGTTDHPPEGTWVEKFIHLRDPRDTPVPVTWARVIAEGEPEQTLRELVRAERANLVRRARLDWIDTPAGPALRGRTLTRHAARGEEVVIETVTYAWRLPQPDGGQIDVVLTAGYDPERMQRLDADLELLARSLHPVTPGRRSAPGPTGDKP